MLILTGTVLQKLELEAVTDTMVDVGYRPGPKLATLVHTLVAGGDCIEDVPQLRAYAPGCSVSTPSPPSTFGTWLHRFALGHVRQLDKITETMLTRAWAADSGPWDGHTFIDTNSTICGVHGYARQGPSYGYTRTKRYQRTLRAHGLTGSMGRVTSAGHNTRGCSTLPTHALRPAVALPMAAVRR